MKCGGRSGVAAAIEDVFRRAQLSIARDHHQIPALSVRSLFVSHRDESV